MDVTEKIRRLMQERGWSMYMLSKKSGLSSTTIQTMFARSTLPSIPTLEAICTAFGITMSQFFQEGDPVPLDDQQKRLLEEFAKLPQHQREAVIALLHAMNIQL